MTQTSTPTSLSLLDLAASGDADAWRRLTSLYGPLVFYWAQKQGLSNADAADVLQEVFSSLSRNVERFEQRANGSFRGWLWVMTRNQLANYFRRRSKNVQAAGGTDAWQKLAAHAESLPDDPSEFTEAQQMNALHHRGLEIVKSEFEKRSWAIFERVVIDDVATTDVADEFDITTNAVRQTKSRILRRLRQVLGEPGTGTVNKFV